MQTNWTKGILNIINHINFNIYLFLEIFYNGSITQLYKIKSLCTINKIFDKPLIQQQRLYSRLCSQLFFVNRIATESE